MTAEGETNLLQTTSPQSSDAASRQTKPPSFETWFRQFDPEAEEIKRLAALSDGVFAFALTLLAIEIRPPENWDGTLQALHGKVSNGLIAYIIGLMIVGGFWVQQRRAFALMQSIDSVARALTFAYLGVVALLPAAISFQIQYSDKPLSFVIYGGCILALAFVTAAFWGYVSLVRRLIREDVPNRYRIGLFLTNMLTMIALGGATAVFYVWEEDPPPLLLGFFGVFFVSAFAIQRWYRRPS